MKRVIALMVVAVVFVSCNTFAQNTLKKQYWPNGKLRISETVDPMGDILGRVYYYESGGKELVEQYDKLGNKILEANFDEDGKLKIDSDGWAVIMSKYKEDNMVAEGYYDESAKLEEVKLYDDNGDLVDKKYFGDRDILPSEEYDPDPTVAGESIQYYNKFGMKEGSTSVSYYDDYFPFFWDMDDMLDEDVFLEDE